MPSFSFSDPNVMSKTGRVVHTTWVANEHGFVDPVNGRHHLDPFSLKRIFILTGRTWLAAIMPECIRLPRWLIGAMFHKFWCCDMEMMIWLYFVSPRERPWRQRVCQTKTLVIAHTTCVSHAFKKEHQDWRIKDASCSVYPWACSVTSRSFSGWDKVYRIGIEVSGAYIDIERRLRSPAILFFHHGEKCWGKSAKLGNTWKRTKSCMPKLYCDLSHIRSWTHHWLWKISSPNVSQW